MTQSLLTPTIIANEALMQLENNTVLGANVHRDYKREFVKIGETVTIRRPVKFSVTTGATRSQQDVEEGQTSITIDKRKHVSWAFNMQDMTMKIEKYSERYVTPACIALANDVDVNLAALYKKLYLRAGTPGTTPATFSALGSLATVLDRGAVPDDGKRKLVLNSDARWTMADALKGIYNEGMAKGYVRAGLLGKLANFDIYGDQNVAQHTTGVFSAGATPVVLNENSHTYSTTTDSGDITTDGWDAANNTVKAGDTFTIAGVNSVNPVSKQDTGHLQTFVATADATSAGGNMTINARPRLITSGPYQTVTAAAANNAVITFTGTENTVYPQNLGFHQNALALVMCPLQLPDSANWKARVDHNGMSIRAVKFYDGNDDEEAIRLDTFYGVEAIYPELGARLWG